MNGSQSHAVYICYVSVIYQTNIYTLCEINNSAGIYVLLKQFAFVSTSGDVRVKYLNLALSAPKAPHICHFHCATPLFCRHMAKSATAWTPSARHTDGKIKLRIYAVIGEAPFYLDWQSGV